MLDLAQLLPHAKKDFKLDTKSDRGVINEVCSSRTSTPVRTQCTGGGPVIIPGVSCAVRTYDVCRKSLYECQGLRVHVPGG